MFTASIYDSILSSNITISLISDLSLMDNYLDLFKDKYPLARAVSEKELSLKLKDIFISKNQQYNEEFLRIRTELITGIKTINEKNLNAFIPIK